MEMTKGDGRLAGMESVVGILLITAILLCPLVLGRFWLFFVAQMLVASYLAISFNLAYSYGRVLVLPKAHSLASVLILRCIWLLRLRSAWY